MHTLEDQNIKKPLKLQTIQQTSCIPLLTLGKIMVLPSLV